MRRKKENRRLKCKIGNSELILIKAGRFQVRWLLFNVSGFWTIHFLFSFLSSLKEFYIKCYACVYVYAATFKIQLF